MNEEKERIPKLNLESFVFTPPGPMGWAFEITEEDEVYAKQGIQNIIEAEEILSLDSFVELSSQQQIVYTNSTVEKNDEVVQQDDMEVIDEAAGEIEEIDNDVEEVVNEKEATIILPSTPLKEPWLSNSQLKRFQNR